MKRRPKPLVPTENLAADADAILQVKFWLTGMSPMVWRRVLMPSSFTLRVLWDGNQYRAGQTIGFFLDDVDALEVDYPNLSKFARVAQEFSVYIASNAGSLINYGERYRAGERISSCLAESSVNAVISKRFAKRQQMQWTKRGAHLLLQTRTRALDGTLRSLFEKWYPGLANDNAAGLCHVAVPRARSVGALGIVRQLRARSATCPSRWREARGPFGLK